MSHTHAHGRTIRRSLVLAGLGAALVLLSACGGDGGGGRDYAVPDQLCDVDFDAETLEPLLPDGDTLKERNQDLGPEQLRCRLLVDEALVLSANQDVIGMDTDPFEMADWSMRLGSTPAPSTGAPDQKVWIVRDLALAVRSCAYQGSPKKLAVAVQLAETGAVPKEANERRKALERFVDGYVTSALKAKGCS